MAIDFSAMLTDDQKRQLLMNRIQQFAAEAYQYSLNLKTAEGIDSEVQIEAAKKALNILEEAMKVHQEELGKLPPATE
jgi:hypothetical protein